MYNPWFFFGLQSAKWGLEAQRAFAKSMLRIVGSGSPEPLRPINVDSAAPEHKSPTPLVVAQSVNSTKPGKAKILGSRPGGSKRAAAASSKRHAKILQTHRKGR